LRSIAVPTEHVSEALKAAREVEETLLAHTTRTARYLDLQRSTMLQQ
jgi:hypothetical protein